MILIFHNFLHFAKLLNKKYGTHTESRILHLHKIFYSAEKALLLQTLEKTGDNRSKAARLLNVSRTTLYEKLRKYHIID